MGSRSHLIYNEPVLQAMLLKSGCGPKASRPRAHDEHSDLQAWSLPADCTVDQARCNQFQAEVVETLTFAGRSGIRTAGHIKPLSGGRHSTTEVFCPVRLSIMRVPATTWNTLPKAKRLPEASCLDSRTSKKKTLPKRQANVEITC